ncbi:unnamed protein product, partial [Urochloa humidicola]
KSPLPALSPLYLIGSSLASSLLGRPCGQMAAAAAGARHPRAKTALTGTRGTAASQADPGSGAAAADPGAASGASGGARRPGARRRLGACEGPTRGDGDGGRRCRGWRGERPRAGANGCQSRWPRIQARRAGPVVVRGGSRRARVQRRGRGGPESSDGLSHVGTRRGMPCSYHVHVFICVVNLGWNHVKSAQAGSRRLLGSEDSLQQLFSAYVDVLLPVLFLFQYRLSNVVWRHTILICLIGCLTTLCAERAATHILLRSLLQKGYTDFGMDIHYETGGDDGGGCGRGLTSRDNLPTLLCCLPMHHHPHFSVHLTIAH